MLHHAAGVTDPANTAYPLRLQYSTLILRIPKSHTGTLLCILYGGVLDT